MTELWRARLTGVGAGDFSIVIPALASSGVYRHVKRLESVVDWAGPLDALTSLDHGNVPVTPYAVGDAVLVAFVDDSPVILGRLV